MWSPQLYQGFINFHSVIILQLPAVAEFSTGETMGHSGDR